MNRKQGLVWVCAGALLLSGCETLDVITKAGTAVGVATGTITPGQADSITKVSDAGGKALEKFTPEQEYYIGRAVAATLLSGYKPYDKAEANNYLNTLGQGLAMASDMPETFSGYHFLALDTDEINAFAAPSGFVLVSRGLLRCCRTEDSVAAVLAHEIGHVQLQHGMSAIQKGRVTSALTVLAAESAKSFGGEQLAELTRAFEGTITDITKTLISSGYSRGAERDADKAAVEIMKRVGYNPNALKDMLLEMEKQNASSDKGFGRTHPKPKDRIKSFEALLAGCPPVSDNAVRQARFRKALAGI